MESSSPGTPHYPEVIVVYLGTLFDKSVRIEHGAQAADPNRFSVCFWSLGSSYNHPLSSYNRGAHNRKSVQRWFDSQLLGFPEKLPSSRAKTLKSACRVGRKDDQLAIRLQVLQTAEIRFLTFPF